VVLRALVVTSIVVMTTVVPLVVAELPALARFRVYVGGASGGGRSPRAAGRNR
jgi:hypothetical protein